MLQRHEEDKVRKGYVIRQGIISTDGYTEDCMKLRINTADKDASDKLSKAIGDPYGNKFIILLDFEMLDSVLPYYKAGLRKRLCYEITSIITTESSHPWYHHQQFQMLSIISKTYPQNMRLLLTLISQVPFELNVKKWFCYMTEFLDKDKLK